MPHCVTTTKLTEFINHPNVDIAAIAAELIRARKKLASLNQAILQCRTVNDKLPYEGKIF